MRRVVTGTRPDGRSTIVYDGHAPVAFTLDPEADNPFGLSRMDGAEASSGQTDGSFVHELWALTADPTVAIVDPTLELQSFIVDIPAGATKWIITRIGPGGDAPMHATPTIDYGLVVSGDIELGLEDGSVHLFAGDAVVVNGVRHSWLAGPDGCVIATVLVGIRSADR